MSLPASSPQVTAFLDSLVPPTKPTLRQELNRLDEIIEVEENFLDNIDSLNYDEVIDIEEAKDAAKLGRRLQTREE